MLNRLQIRLIFSFIAVLLLTLCIIGGALLIFLSSRDVPIDPLVNDMGVVSVQTDFLGEFNQQRQSGERSLATNRGETLGFATEYLESIAAETSYRLMLISDGNQVAYDSLGQFAERDRIRLAPSAQRPVDLPDNREAGLGSGTFEDESGQEWVYVVRRLVGNNPQNGGNNNGRQQIIAGNIDYVVATPMPQQTLRRVLANFGETFLLPLLWSGLIGIFFAGLLSYWLSRSVARPLQNIAVATQKLASGDYDYRVPEARGVTEARVLARAFNDMTTQVQANQQAQQDFIANVAHDLRTPLTSIQGYSQAIMEGVAADPQHTQHAASIIHSEAGRLTRLVNDLLDLVKIQAGRMKMMRQAVEIDLLLRTIGDSMQIKAQEKTVKLHVDIPNLNRIAGDGDRLAQVFTNLVDNAIKHTDSGGQVWLVAELEAKGIAVRVQDTGEGIPPDDLARIFERFYQVDKSRNRHEQKNGAGLGLAITHEIITAHGGTISVKSEVNKGTRFTVWLPQLDTDQSTIIYRR